MRMWLGYEWFQKVWEPWLFKLEACGEDRYSALASDGVVFGVSNLLTCADKIIG